jgi:hypothetical protein
MDTGRRPVQNRFHLSPTLPFRLTYSILIRAGAMLNKEFRGWPIAEALRRVADRELVVDYIAKCRARANIPVLNRCGESEPTSDECQLARSLLFEQLHRHVVEKRLIVWGRTGRADATLEPIPSALIEKIRFREAVSKDNPQAMCGTEPIFDVRIFPLILAPNVAEFVGRISLKHALADLVLGDPQVQCLGRSTRKRTSPSELHVANRYRGRHYWPMDPDVVYFHATYPDQFGEYYCYFGVPGRLAVHVLGSRFRALLDLLYREVYLAEGDATRPNGLPNILPAIWSHKAYFIDDRTGDVLEDAFDKVDESKTKHFADGREYYEIRWRAVMLTPSKYPVCISRAEPETRPAAQQLPTKRIPTKAVTVTRCAAWLEAEMRGSPSIRPKRKQEFLLEAQSKWPDLSERRFDRLWESAIESTGAYAWSGPGAPKRSGRSK